MVLGADGCVRNASELIEKMMGPGPAKDALALVALHDACYRGGELPGERLQGRASYSSETNVTGEDIEQGRNKTIMVRRSHVSSCGLVLVDKQWLSTAPLNEWYGVTVGDSGRVTGLDLRGCGLTGELPPELSLLSYLEALDLRDNPELKPEAWFASLGLLGMHTPKWAGRRLRGLRASHSGRCSPDCARAPVCGQT